MANKSVIAVDLGASSGRVMRVDFDGQNFSMEEVNRFVNTPIQAGDTLYWDALRLWHDIQTGVDRAAKDAAAVGITTWGVDYALLDRDGRLLANPVHYRDSRTDGVMDWVFGQVPSETIFDRTGIQFMQLNTLFQLAAMVKDNSPLLDYTETLLTIPSLFNYWLCGSLTSEFTHVTTTQCYNPQSGTWDYDTLGALNIPTGFLPEIIPAGSRIGDYNGLPVIAPATHDTGSAVVAVPATDENYAYISSGTWSLIGLELDSPVINAGAHAANVTNEGGVNGTFRFLKNVMGLWLEQQSRATWEASGEETDFATLIAAAQATEPFRSLIDPDDALFLPPGDMPKRIRDYCTRTGQPVPETTGQIIRTIYDSLALKYRYALDQLATLAGRTVDRIHIIGGGSQNSLLNQLTADATGRIVVAGPVEATALGNAIVQFISLGELGGLAEARALLSRTLDTQTFTPQDTAVWDAHFDRFRALVG